MTGAAFLAFSIDAGVAVILIGALLTLVRLMRGPSLPDRVVALDAMTVAIVAFCGIKAIETDDASYLDVAIVLGLVGFLATAALARFAERRQRRREQAEEQE